MEAILVKIACSFAHTHRERNAICLKQIYNAYYVVFCHFLWLIFDIMNITMLCDLLLNRTTRNGCALLIHI